MAKTPWRGKAAGTRPSMGAALAAVVLGALLMAPAPCLAARKALVEDLERSASGSGSSSGSSRGSLSRAGGRRRLLQEDTPDILDEVIDEEEYGLFGAFEAAYEPSIGCYGGYGLYGYYGYFHGVYGVYDDKPVIEEDVFFDENQLLAADWHGPLPAPTPFPFPRRALREGMVLDDMPDGEFDLPLVAVDQAYEYDFVESGGKYGYYFGGVYGMYYGSIGVYGTYGGEAAVMEQWLAAETEAQSVLDQYLDQKASDLLAESMEAGDVYLLE